MPVVLCKKYLKYQIYKFYIKHYSNPLKDQILRLSSIYIKLAFTLVEPLLLGVVNFIIVAYSHYMLFSTLLSVYFE